MKNAVRFAIPAVLSLAAAASFAQAVQPATGLTREQVRAEALEASRLGLTQLNGENAQIATPAQAEQIRLAGLRAVAQAQGLPTSNLTPVATSAASPSREQVRAEAVEASRLGLTQLNGSNAKRATPAQTEQIRLAGQRAVAQAQGLPASNFTPVAAPAASLSREQVRAEALEASRLGLTQLNGSNAKTATPAQIEQIRLAGLRALNSQTAQK